MKNTHHYFIIGLCLFLFSCTSTPTQYFPNGVKNDHPYFPKPVGYVNDFDSILSVEQIDQLTKLIVDHEQKTTNQIAIIIIDSITPYTNLYNYATDLAKHWGLGKKGNNNGVLIVLQPEAQQIRIQNSTGLEAKLTNAETKKIIDDVIVPTFMFKGFHAGLSKGIEAIIKEIE